MENPAKSMTIIVFSNDMDRAIAAFILATGAAVSGIRVTMFFTFWGLALLRKKHFLRRGKTLVERLFGWMLPEGPGGTVLSKMNFFGAGTAMMKRVMARKNIPRLEELINLAASLDVTLVACTTSMGMMGFEPGELIDGIEVGGVTTYLGSATVSNVNLFI